MPPDEYLNLDQDKLKAFHKKYQVDQWTYTLSQLVASYKSHDTKAFHKAV